MKNRRPHKYILRFLIVSFGYITFIIGDDSFSIMDFGLRKMIFTAIFYTYWLAVWFNAEFFVNLLHKKQEEARRNENIYIYLLFIINFVFAFVAGFGFNLTYRFWDIYFFQGIDHWSIVPIFNPELTMSYFSFYMIVFTADIFLYSKLERKEGQLRMEKMKRENMKAQYLVLKSQLDPHFLFNSLSVLTSIIHSDVQLAEEFILRLSKTLRYVIEKKELTLVSLEEEIGFIDDYFFLIHNRFEEGIVFENTLDDTIIQESYIPPASLQLLIENAVKHNRFSKEEPLNIKLYSENGNIIVRNNINAREDHIDSTNQGLHNVSQRYSYLSNSEVRIVIDEHDFMVSMPLLTKEDYEHFNF